MASIFDRYETWNNSVAFDMTLVAWGQSFYGTGLPLAGASFLMSKKAVGDGHGKLYAHTGTFGTNGVPTGAALATSDAFDTSVLDSSYTWQYLTFSTPYITTSGTPYFIVFDFALDDIAMRSDFGTPTHPGNCASFSAGSWNPQANMDVCFRVYGTGGGGGYGRDRMRLGQGLRR